MGASEIYNAWKDKKREKQYKIPKGKKCEDPRHRSGDDDEAYARVKTKYDDYYVCEVCASKIF